MISLTTPQPPLLDRLTGWLEHPIGKFVTGGIFPACIALLTSVGYQGYTRYDDNKIKVKDAFVNEALSYESVSLAVLEPLLTQSGKIERKDRQALIDNLIQQSQTLYAASNLLKESKIPIAERYQQELLAVRDLVNKLEPSRVTEFFAASKPLLVDRDRLVFALEPSRFSQQRGNTSSMSPPLETRNRP